MSSFKNSELRAPSSALVGAFTLVELLVVVAILCLLFALLFPVVLGTRDVAYRAACLNNLRQTAVIFHSFATDHSGNLPLGNATDPRVLRPDMHAQIEYYYPGPYDIFYCPAPTQDKTVEWWYKPVPANQHVYIGYVYVANLDEKNCHKFIYGDPVTSILDPGADKDPILFDQCLKSRPGALPWVNFPHDGTHKKAGMNALFGDLHAEWRNFENMRVSYHYIGPADLWW
jgi:prepilin-type N-terminal cleavage/methylation domain-containing protein